MDISIAIFCEKLEPVKGRFEAEVRHYRETREPQPGAQHPNRR
jgi:hypothetical protein